MDLHDNATDFEVHETNNVKTDSVLPNISESECSFAPPVIAKVSETSTKINRQLICPMYVRIFCRINGHHNSNEFGPKRQPVDDELVVYTWKDATLAELADLIKEVNEESRRKDATFDFQLVYADLKGKFMFKSIGKVSNSKPNREAEKTLENFRFRQGDFIDVAIYFGAMSSIDSSNYAKRPKYAPVHRIR